MPTMRRNARQNNNQGPGSERIDKRTLDPLPDRVKDLGPYITYIYTYAAIVYSAGRKRGRK